MTGSRQRYRTASSKRITPLLACRVFYGLIEGGITYPAIFSSGINRAQVDPLLDELIETFIAKYTGERA